MSKTRESVVKFGQNRGVGRIWLEGKWLTEMGFIVGSRYSLSLGANKAIILCAQPGSAGSHGTVSGRTSGSRPGAIIDINSKEIAAHLGDTDRLKVVADHGVITITPTKSAIKRAARVLTALAIGLFVGGGLLCQAAKAAGFDTAAAVEIEPAYAEVWENNHTKGSMLNMSIDEVDWHRLKERVGDVGLLTAGVPCEPYSAIRTLDKGTGAKRDKSLPPEAHDLGDMTFWALQATDILNPHTLIIENVPSYLDSASGYIAKHVLTRMGYTVDSKIIDSHDYGALQARKRAIIVATTFDSVDWPAPEPVKITLGHILDQIPDDSNQWFGEGYWAVEHWKKQTAKGNGFAPPVIRESDTSLVTLKKRYLSLQGDNVVVGHPRKPNLYRWLTLAECRRIMTLPDTYQLCDAKTTAGEVLGQGVVVDVMAKIISSVTRQGQRGPKTTARGFGVPVPLV